MTNEKLPRIIGPNCEFCGVNASKCAHANAFRAQGLLEKSEALANEDKVYQNFKGLPRVIGRICEFCGVDAKECQHSEQRRAIAFGRQTAEIEKPQAEEAGEPPVGTGKDPEGGDDSETHEPRVESSGDAEMDKLMDENPEGQSDEDLSQEAEEAGEDSQL